MKRLQSDEDQIEFDFRNGRGSVRGRWPVTLTLVGLFLLGVLWIFWPF